MNNVSLEWLQIIFYKRTLFNRGKNINDNTSVGQYGYYMHFNCQQIIHIAHMYALGYPKEISAIVVQYMYQVQWVHGIIKFNMNMLITCYLFIAFCRYMYLQNTLPQLSVYFDFNNSFLQFDLESVQMSIKSIKNCLLQFVNVYYVYCSCFAHLIVSFAITLIGNE